MSELTDFRVADLAADGFERGPRRHPLTRRTLLAAGLVAATAALTLLAVGRAQDSATNTTKTQLGPADTCFVTQTSLGTPFQVDSGRLAQEMAAEPQRRHLDAGATERPLRNCAREMVLVHHESLPFPEPAQRPSNQGESRLDPRHVHPTGDEARAFKACPSTK